MIKPGKRLLDPDLRCLINRLDRIIDTNPFPNLLARAKLTKVRISELSQIYLHFVKYNPNDLLTDQFIDRWITRAINHRGLRFYFTDGEKKIHAVWLTTATDAAKFKNLLGANPLRNR